MSDPYCIGIDPGVSGAIVVLQGGTPIEWMRMPSMKVGSANRVNAAEIERMLANFDTGHAYLELVGAMPGQGVTGMFNFGHATGTVTGLLAAMHIPHTLVAPQSWKKRAGLIGKDKDAARARAIQLWPTWSELGAIGKGQALADAALIALHGERA